MFHCSFWLVLPVVGKLQNEPKDQGFVSCLTLQNAVKSTRKPKLTFLRQAQTRFSAHEFSRISPLQEMRPFFAADY